MARKKKEMGLRIKLLRDEWNMSLDDLSKLSGISKATLHRYETNASKAIDYNKLQIIADCLHVDIDRLTGESDEKIQEEDLKYILTILNLFNYKYEYVEEIDKYRIYFNSQHEPEKRYSIIEISPTALSSLQGNLTMLTKAMLYELQLYVVKK